MSKRRTLQRILVVAEEPSIGKALAFGLSSEDVTVDIVYEGTHGINLGTTNGYEVLIVDRRLPDIDGLELVRRIKERFPETVVIMIADDPGEEPGEPEDDGQVSAYLEKPLRLGMVKDAIRREIEENESTEN